MLSRIILYIGLFAIAYGASIPSQLDHISLDTDLIARATSELPPPGPNFEIPLLVFFFAKKSDLIGGVVDNSWFHDISSYPEFADRTTDKLTDQVKRAVVMDSKKTERLGVEVEDEVGRMRFTRTTAWQRHFVWQQKSEDSKVLIHVSSDSVVLFAKTFRIVTSMSLLLQLAIHISSRFTSISLRCGFLVPIE
jgi:hypothetical protein